MGVFCGRGFGGCDGGDLILEVPNSSWKGFLDGEGAGVISFRFGGVEEIVMGMSCFCSWVFRRGSFFLGFGLWVFVRGFSGAGPSSSGCVPGFLFVGFCFGFLFLVWVFFGAGSSSSINRQKI